MNDQPNPVIQQVQDNENTMTRFPRYVVLSSPGDGLVKLTFSEGKDKEAYAFVITSEVLRRLIPKLENAAAHADKSLKSHTTTIQ